MSTPEQETWRQEERRVYGLGVEIRCASANDAALAAGILNQSDAADHAAAARLKDAEADLREAMAALRSAKAHVEDLEDAWLRGVIHETDGKGGTRSTRNAYVRCDLSDILSRLSARYGESGGG